MTKALADHPGKETLMLTGKPEVVNSDQGSQFMRMRLYRPSGNRGAS
jgi:hypothetical protein